ncbi:MAG: 2-hydroxy-3-keto-5-methylthiopentenyl-1-phosphate phosphatase [Myxococcota bacterium]
MTKSDDGLSPYEDTATRLAQSTCIALFCDFDGTYSVQDVGSTIARTYLGDRRTELWQRYEQGEFDPWSFNLELFAGFRFPPQELHEFLATIDLDPGARALQAYCADNNIAFRILSDGFDYNLDWLQGHYGVSFDYAANHLSYGGAAGDEWVIAPGARNEACECGTGVCKRTIIREQRKLRPGAFCVHVGNGRVSDLCGAEEADLAFGKDSLATALLERKHPFEPFDSLHDVVATLKGFVEDAKALRA